MADDNAIKPGFQPGNKFGAPKGNQNAKKHGIWKRSLEAALERFAKKHADKTAHYDLKDLKDRGLALVADEVVARAAAGDRDCWQEIANRLDGKVAQAVIAMGDEDGGPVRIERIERVIVAATHVADESSVENTTH